LRRDCQERRHCCLGLLRWASWSRESRPRKCPFRGVVALGRLLLALFHAGDIPDKARTATQAVISLCTANGTLSTKSLIRSTACASTIAPLFLSLLAAKFRRVEIAWHWTSSFSSNDSNSMRGVRKPESIMGDSFDGWIETFRTHAAAERMRGR